MTAEEVIAEIVGHLAERQSPKDRLVPMANFFAMLGGPDRVYAVAEAIIARREGGWLAIAAHRSARLARKAAYEDDLLAASQEGRSLAAVSRDYGYSSQVSPTVKRDLGLHGSKRYMDRVRLVEVGRPGMTITELANAAGYRPDSLRNWVKYGHLQKLFVLRKDKSNVYRIAKVRRED
jgi:lambda repressor-like predicted transcriptional regulator